MLVCPLILSVTGSCSALLVILTSSYNTILLTMMQPTVMLHT